LSGGFAMSSTRYACEIQVSDGNGSCEIGSGWTGRLTDPSKQ
jgi:hypothetical protein